MKLNIFSAITKIASLLAMALLMYACSNDIDVPVTDEKSYENAIKTYGYLTHQNMSGTEVDIDLRTLNSQRNICLGTTKPTSVEMNAQVEIITDSIQVSNFNLKNGTNYRLFPARQVMLENDGKLTVKAGQVISAPLIVTFKKDSSVTPEGTDWLLPIKIKDNATNIVSDKQILWFHIRIGKDGTIRPRTVSNIACIQINNVNPLCAGLYKLKDSGEPFFDQISIFAANINWDVQKKKAYISFNENLSVLLAQRDKYIKPLQDMGIKVTLSLLGNRDGVCFRNFNTEGAKDFAREIKSVVDAYGFDGIMFDEEYMNYGSNGLPLPNDTSWIQLCYELKQIMPDKLLTLYTYDINSDFKGTVSGIPAGHFLDYAFRYSTDNFNVGVREQTNSFNELDARKYGPMSIMLYDDYIPSNFGGVRPSLNVLKSSRITQIQTIKEKYGCNFFYNLYGYCLSNGKPSNIINTLGNKGFDPLNNAIDYSEYLSVYSQIMFGEDVYREGLPLRKDY